VRPRDADGLADALVSVLGDPERARSMGLAGRKKVEAEFSLDACASATFAVYDELLSKKSRS
jgi:glycosyltransferase involved in cell wall biosynthesis